MTYCQSLYVYITVEMSLSMMNVITINIIITPTIPRPLEETQSSDALMRLRIVRDSADKFSERRAFISSSLGDSISRHSSVV